MLGADLHTDGRKLVGIVDAVGEVVGGYVDLIQVGLVLCQVVVPSHNALPDFAVEVHILGVQPIDFQVKHQRLARLIEAANGLAVFRVFQDAWVVAIGCSDADDLGEAACVGGVEGTKLVHFRVIVASATPSETAGRHKSIAEAELVLVASDGVALRKDRHCKGDEQSDKN